MTKSGPLNILTFDWHEPYICMLAQTGHRFSVVEVEKGGVFGWQSFMRPVPPNVTLLTEADGLERLYRDEFHLVICHNMRDLLTVQGVKVPKVKILHNKMSTEIALGKNRLTIEDYRRVIQEFVARGDLSLVFISETKREDAGLDGTVVPPGIDVTDYGGYHGEEGRVLRVGNLMKERDIMMGFSLQEEILKDVPSTLLGVNPTVPGSRVSESWDDLKMHFQSHRVFLNTTLPPREDGYNLAMLEAMATGMPVVSMTNPTSPIVDGTNGYIGDDIPYLRERILELLSNRDLAVELGQKGRETAAREFPMSRFVSRWNDVLSRVANQQPIKVRKKGKHREQGSAAGPKTSRKRVLLCYTAYPATTGHYLERSLRKNHDVISCGPCITPEIIKAWDLENMRETPHHHDIHVPFPGPVDMRTVIDSLETGWEPDLFIWVETGIGFLLEGLSALRCPKACYFIDTHLHRDDHIAWASRFDVVFLAQRAYIPAFQRAGIRHVFWLPLACAPEFHGKAEMPKDHDIGFVGTIGPENGRRARLLKGLSKRFDLHIERCFLKDMARVFSASKVIFNNAIKDDLNMRVFEALCSGSLLITDRATGSGLEEFFEDRKHLVIYEDDNLEKTVDYYLKNENEREAIAAAGRREVLERHTYDHRADEMITRVGSLVESGAFTEPRGTYYWSERQDVIEQVPLEAKRVLDVGCAAGLMGKRLKERGAREVFGIEQNPKIAREAEGNLDRVWTANVETFEPPWEQGYFDAIIFGDVLEHLADPLSTLMRLKPYLKAGGSIIASIPNVRFWSVVQGLAEGDWTYQDAGILDRTHLRFFTLNEIRRFFSSAGLDVVNVGAKLDSRINELSGQSYPRRLDFGRMSIEVASEAEMTEFFVFQYIVTARPKQIAEHADTAEELEEKGCLLQAKQQCISIV